MGRYNIVGKTVVTGKYLSTYILILSSILWRRTENNRRAGSAVVAGVTSDRIHRTLIYIYVYIGHDCI